MTDPFNLAGLLASTAEGNQAAFGDLYKATSGTVFAVLNRMIMRRDLAEDVLQETYVRVWRYASRFDAGRGSAMGWILTIARNQARERRHRAPSHQSLDDAAEIPSLEPEPIDWAIAGEDANRLKTCLQRLEEEPRRCIVLAFVHGYSHSELATKWGHPVGTVKSWIRRGIQRLKECLER